MKNRIARRCLVTVGTCLTVGAILMASVAPASAQSERRQSAVSRDAIDALAGFYNKKTGLWDTTGWWNSANALTATIDYAQVTDDHRHDWMIENTWRKNVSAEDGNFVNAYVDDTGWWALAWIRAYDLTGNKRYLRTAVHDVDYMWSNHTDACGGGVLWNRDKKYKNAVTNELMIKAAASLHNRMPGDHKYLDMAKKNWDWFLESGMINSDHMINDGLDEDDCSNNGEVTWTYNQGIILGAAVELADATGNQRYLTKAKTLADASTRNSAIHTDGVLTESCEDDDCGEDGPTFKGAYVRGLGELNAALPDRPYQDYLQRQADTAHRKDRTASDLYGVHWAGPISAITAATQQSAAEAQIAPLRHGKHRLSR